MAQLLEAAGTEVSYLPPYSPYPNPIEPAECANRLTNSGYRVT